ncbi:hypothetical protein AaE_014023 [Aphanomyces astaci]|uniref:Uncharacterized protein n=1 Tax=Aphanomyces astaci TaxID=112090 RepID=A0A6A4ZGP8_APHAT|nr:hypothetical protein AaE_014023 [Aphanomyces astaci]
MCCIDTTTLLAISLVPPATWKWRGPWPLCTRPVNSGSDASWTVIPGLLSSAVVLSRHRVLENNMTSYFGDRGDGITQFQR